MGRVCAVTCDGSNFCKLLIVNICDGVTDEYPCGCGEAEQSPLQGGRCSNLDASALQSRSLAPAKRVFSFGVERMEGRHRLQIPKGSSHKSTRVSTRASAHICHRRRSEAVQSLRSRRW